MKELVSFQLTVISILNEKQTITIKTLSKFQRYQKLQKSNWGSTSINDAPDSEGSLESQYNVMLRHPMSATQSVSRTLQSCSWNKKYFFQYLTSKTEGLQ